MKKKTIKARNAKWLFCPHLAGLGITYKDPRFGKQYDFGTCTTSRGKMLITWGLNASAADLVDGVDYVCLGNVWENGGTRANYEAIITKI
jgi:hypothetical protein